MSPKASADAGDRSQPAHLVGEAECLGRPVEIAAGIADKRHDLELFAHFSGQHEALELARKLELLTRVDHRLQRVSNPAADNESGLVGEPTDLQATLLRGFGHCGE